MSSSVLYFFILRQPNRLSAHSYDLSFELYSATVIDPVSHHRTSVKEAFISLSLFLKYSHHTVIISHLNQRGTATEIRSVFHIFIYCLSTVQSEFCVTFGFFVLQFVFVFIFLC